MCIACNDVPQPPGWTIEQEREYVAHWEKIEPADVANELLDIYEPLIGLERCLAFYGAICVPREFIDKHCCRGKQS